MESLDWNLVRAFCATVETGSLSAAARKLDLTQPTLSRQIAALEAMLGATLFTRAGKRLIPTLTGLGLAEHAQAMAGAADALTIAAAGRSARIEGRVSISASDAVSAYLLPDIVALIRREAPEITTVIVASNAISNLSRREADIAIRHVRPTEPDLIGRLIGHTEAHLYASKAWIDRCGCPRSATDIPDGELLGAEPVERYSAHLEGVGLPAPPDRFRIVSENSVVLWEMVRRGLGASMMLRVIAAATPDVVLLLPQMRPTLVPVWLVTHRELRTSRRIRTVFDTLAGELTRLCCDAGQTGDDHEAIELR